MRIIGNVPRWILLDQPAEMSESPDGDYVLWSDYEALLTNLNKCAHWLTVAYYANLGRNPQIAAECLREYKEIFGQDMPVAIGGTDDTARP
jgi:hypothetical protein